MEEKKISERNLLEFINLLSTLEEVEIMGVAKILGVPTMKEDGKEPREGTDILSDMIDAFIIMQRRPRRELIQVMRAANKRK